jgi:PAS domain S-box-containing protein
VGKFSENPGDVSMMDSISQNLDYVFFCYGLSYILIAAVTFSLQRNRTLGLPWWQLGSFSLLLGLVAWLNVTALSFGDSPAMFTTRLILMMAANVMLMEFGRRSLRLLGSVAIPWWTTALAGAIALAALTGSESISKVIPRYVLTFPGGLLSAWALWQLSKQSTDGKQAIQTAAVAMLLFAGLAGLVTAPAGFFPANVLNQDVLQDHTGLSAALLRSVIAVLLALALSRYVSQTAIRSTFYGESFRVSSGHTRMVAILIPVLFIGWLGTNLIGHNQRMLWATSFRSHADIISTSTRLALDSLLRRDTGLTDELRRAIALQVRSNRAGLSGEYAMYVAVRNPDGTFQLLDADTTFYRLNGPLPDIPVFHHVKSDLSTPLPTDSAIAYLPQRQAFGIRLVVVENFPSPGQSVDMLFFDDARDEQRLYFQRRLMPLAIVFLLSVSIVVLAVAFHRVRQSMAENQLIANRYRLIFDHSVAGKYVSAPDGRILLCNDSFRRLLGIADADLQSINAASLYSHPDERARFLERLVTDKVLSHYNTELVRPDGAVLRIIESATGTFDRAGNLVQIQGSIIDMTERYAAEATVKQRERLLQGLAAASQVLITSSDLESAIPVALASIGDSALVDRIRLFENLPDSNGQRNRIIERFVWSRNDLFTIASRHPLDHRNFADGFDRWYNDFLTGAVISGPLDQFPETERQVFAGTGIQSLLACPIIYDGFLWGFIEFEDCQSSRDWSEHDTAAHRSAGLMLASSIERQRIEESLQVKNAAVASSASAIGLADLDGMIIYVNDAYCRLWQYDRPADVIGRPISDFAVNPHDPETVRNALTATGRFSGESVAKRKDGSVFQIQMIANLVTNDRGKPLCMMASFEDITERKRFERLLRDVAEHISAKTGPEYFSTVVSFIAQELHVHTAFIGEYLEAADSIRTLAVYRGKEAVPNFEYPLAGTPCEQVIGRQSCFLDHGIQDLYPSDTLLKTLEADSYAAIPLFSSSNQPLGILAVLGNSTQSLDEQKTTTLLQIFASRVAAEMERNRAEEALRRSEQSYRLMSENMSDVVWLMDAATGTFKYISPSIERIRGYTPEEVMAQPLDAMLTPESYAVVTDVLPRSLREFAAGDEAWRHYTLQLDQRHRDGSIVHTEVVTTFVTDHENVVREILGVTRDITERMHAEEAIRESEERFRSVFQEGPLGMVIVGLDFRFSVVNAAFCTMLGYTESELIGRKFTDVTHPENVAVDSAAVKRVIRGDLPTYMTMKRYIRKDGDYVWAHLKVTGVHDSAGHVTYLLGMVEDVTERIQAEQALTKSESRLRMITENMTNLVSFMDEQGLVRYVSPSYKHNLGYNPDDLLGVPNDRLLHPDDAQRIDRIFRDAIAHRETTLRTEGRVRHADGYYLWHEINSTILYDTSNRFTGCVVASLDIHDRKIATEALTQREQQLQSLFDNMLEGVALHELIFNDEGTPVDYRILDVNSKYEVILGLKRAGLVGKPATEAYHTDSAPYLAEYADVALTGRSIHMESYFAPLDRHFSISVAPWGQGGFATIFTDITERKKTEDHIQALNRQLESRIVALTQPLSDTSNLRLEDIFDLQEIQRIQDAFAAATGVASIITDTQGNPITRPSNFCHLCEHIIRKTDQGLKNCYHSDAIIGRKHTDGPIMQPCLSGGLWDGGTSICVGDHHIANWLIGQVLEEPLNEENMLEYARTIGADPVEFREALSQVTRMPHEQFSKVCQALYIIANQLSDMAVQNVQQARFITERKEAEADRIRLEEQLRQALKLESIGHLAGGVAHDFNNMLTPIVGYAEMLQFQLSKDHPYQDTLQQIVRAAMRARDLTRQLLAFARKQTLAMKVLNLNEVILNFEKMLRRTVRENVSISLNLREDLGWFMGDEGQIEQIILNLAVNAQDAMPDGGKLILETSEVELEGGSSDGVDDVRPGRYVMMSISDTGSGMDKDTLSKIFDPFFTTKGLGRGTGLGLSTVYGIVRQHGGHIHVYSEPGHGTTFRIYFPRTEQVSLTPQLPESSLVPVQGKETILLVEDEEQVRAVALEILRQYGYTVLPASDGDDALEVAANFDAPIHLVVTDIIMPTMNGRELFTKLSLSRPGLKSLFMSGYSEDVIAHHGVLEAGVNFIQKPFSLHAFASRVRQVLDQVAADSA